MTGTGLRFLLSTDPRRRIGPGTPGGNRGGLLSHGPPVRRRLISLRGRDRRGLVVELAHGLRLAPQRASTRAPIRGHQAKQEDDRLARDEEQGDDDEEQGGAEP